IATSGTAEAIAVACRGLYKSKAAGGNSAGRAQVQRLAKKLSRLPVSERRKIPGIGPRRAEIIVAGAAVYAELLERCRLRSFRYSPLGLRDGLLAQMAADYSRSTRSRQQIATERWESVLHCARQYGVELHHALQVRDFALELFRRLQSLHGLPPEYEELLSAAAMLYEVGT